MAGTGDGVTCECVNCEQLYNPNRNPKWICTYHPGCYGLAGPIKRGLGWTCCGRDRLEPGCKTGPHQSEYTPVSRPLRESLDEYMGLASKHRMTRSRSLPDVRRTGHSRITVTLQMEMSEFQPSVFVSSLARAIPVDPVSISILSMQPGVKVDFMLEGARDTMADKVVETLQSKGLKHFVVVDATVQHHDDGAAAAARRHTSIPPAKKVNTKTVAKGKAAKARVPKPSAKSSP